MTPGKKHRAREAECRSCCIHIHSGIYMHLHVQQDGPSASLAAWVFLTHFPYVIKKSKSTFVLKHGPSESNETTFEVARFLVFMLWHFFWKSLRESKSDFRENREK